MFTVFGFYKFKIINDLKKHKSLIQETIDRNSIKGTIILSTEGLNGSIAGRKKNVFNFIKTFKKKLRVKEFDSDNISLSKFQPFHKGRVKIKKEVVPFGLKINNKNKKLNKYVSSKSWNKLISHQDTLVIDARKPFEYDVGTFKNAINPKIQNFREFPKYLRKIKNKNCSYVLYWWNQMRKASVFLKKKGFKNVYQLKGGILNYLSKTKKR